MANGKMSNVYNMLTPLPLEMAEKVFKFLNFEELKVAEKVCTSWKMFIVENDMKKKQKIR